jgi:hypothetical protein
MQSTGGRGVQVNQRVRASPKRPQEKWPSQLSLQLNKIITNQCHINITADRSSAAINKCKRQHLDANIRRTVRRA